MNSSIPISQISQNPSYPLSKNLSAKDLSAVKIQRLFRGFQARQSFLPRSLYSKYCFECDHLDATDPRAPDGKTAVILPKRLPQIVIKKTGEAPGKERFRKTEAIRSIVQSKGWDCLRIPKVRLFNGFLIEERFPINTDPGYNANFYLSDLDRCNDLVHQFTRLFFTSGYIDYLVEKDVTDNSIIRIRYDNIPFILQEKNGKQTTSIALIDLERSNVGTNIKSASHRLYILASLFPFHLRIIEEEASKASILIGEKERVVIDNAILHSKRYLQKLNQKYLASQPINYPLPKQNYVTYEYFGGRFGDNLMTYLHAKWVSYKDRIPILYKPFPYSSELVLDQTECQYHIERQKEFEEVRLRQNAAIPSEFSSTPKIYSVHYFPESNWEKQYGTRHNGKPWIDTFSVDWNDKGFRKEIQPLLQPKTTLATVLPPQEKISIAIHFREGGGFDQNIETLNLPLKFPPFDFYIKGLLAIADRFKEQPIYCYLFTDAKDPITYLEKIRAQLPKDLDIILDCRSSGNSHDACVLEDFFSLSKFDALVYPQSNFSMIPALTHDFVASCTAIVGLEKSEIKPQITINEERSQAAINRIQVS